MRGALKSNQILSTTLNVIIFDWFLPIHACAFHYYTICREEKYILVRILVCVNTCFFPIHKSHSTQEVALNSNYLCTSSLESMTYEACFSTL